MHCCCKKMSCATKKKTDACSTVYILSSRRYITVPVAPTLQVLELLCGRRTFAKQLGLLEINDKIRFCFFVWTSWTSGLHLPHGNSIWHRLEKTSLWRRKPRLRISVWPSECCSCGEWECGFGPSLSFPETCPYGCCGCCWWCHWN